MNLQKEINTSQLLTSLGACIILGIILAYFLSPHLRKSTLVEDTLKLEKQQGYTGAVNSPPKSFRNPSQEGEVKGACAQVITRAKNLVTGEIQDFPTTCAVPEGWEPVN